MQFLVISDSHGKVSKINEILERVGHIDGVFFLGDGLSDLAHCDMDNLYEVRGNCDVLSLGNASIPDKRIVHVCNKTVLMCHGHRYGVKSGLGNLIYAAAENNADIVLFGHTHDPMDTRLCPEDFPTLNKPTYFFNPGAVESYRSSWGIMTITLRGEILFSHGEL